MLSSKKAFMFASLSRLLKVSSKLQILSENTCTMTLLTSI